MQIGESANKGKESHVLVVGSSSRANDSSAASPFAASLSLASLGMSVASSVAAAPWPLRVLCFGLPVALTWTLYDGTLASLHTFLQSLAFLLLLPEGAFALRGSIGSRPRPVTLRRHVYLQLGTLVLALLGIAVMLIHRHLKQARHFTSLHSWLGVSAVLVSELGGLLGAITFSGLVPISRTRQLSAAKYHRMLGRLSLFLSTLAFLSAIKILDPQHPRHKGWRTYALGVALVAHAVGVQSVLWRSVLSRDDTTRSPGPLLLKPRLTPIKAAHGPSSP